jgi:dethiobiotin synthetase
VSVVCVTGTDTEVGKTWVTAALGAALVAQGRSVVAIKPVESGVALDGVEDGALLAEATGQRAPLQALTRLRAPVAPPVAADREGVRLDALGTLNHTLMTLELLEAAGIRPLGVVLNTVRQDNSTGANAAALKRVRPFLEVVTVPTVASWREAIPAMGPVVKWLPQ